MGHVLLPATTLSKVFDLKIYCHVNGVDIPQSKYFLLICVDLVHVQQWKQSFVRHERNIISAMWTNHIIIRNNTSNGMSIPNEMLTVSISF